MYTVTEETPVYKSEKERQEKLEEAALELIRLVQEMKRSDSIERNK